MKYNGKKLEGPNVLELYLPRGDSVILIRARAVLDYDEFHKLVPVPEPPVKILKGGAKVPDFEHPTYLVSMNQYGEKKTQWMFLQSLKATNGLEWEQVDLADPATWKNYEKELSDAGFSEQERLRILQLIITANALDEKKLEEARERFLSGTLPLLHAEQSSSQTNGASSTPSGELVSGSTSDHQELSPVGTP